MLIHSGEFQQAKLIYKRLQKSRKDYPKIWLSTIIVLVKKACFAK